MMTGPRSLWVGAALVLLGACGGKTGNDEEASDGAVTGAESASEPTGGTGSATAAMCEEQSAALLRGFGRRRPGIDFAGTTGDETGGSSGGSSGDGTTGAEHQICPDHTEVDACCCFSDVPNGIGPNVVCDVVGLCPTIVLRKDAGLVLLSCPETVDCALAALIAGKPGAIGWTIITGGEGGQDATDLFIAGDGTGFEWSYSEYDLFCSIDPVRHWMLESKDYFIGCTKKAAVLERFECLTGAFGEVLEECIGGADCGPGI